MRWIHWIALAALGVGCGSESAQTSASAESESETPALVDEAAEAPEEDGEALEVEEEVAAAPTPCTQDLLMLRVHTGTLLPSEERQTGVLQERLARVGYDVALRDAAQDEAELAERVLSGSGAGAAPPLFGRASRVLILRIAPPRTRDDGDFVSQGISGVVLLRARDMEPLFVLRLEEESGWRRSDGAWSEWLQGLLREAEAS